MMKQTWPLDNIPSLFTTKATRLGVISLSFYRFYSPFVFYLLCFLFRVNMMFVYKVRTWKFTAGEIHKDQVFCHQLSFLIRMVHRPVRVESLQEHEHERSRVEEVGQNRDQPAKLHLMKVMIMILILSSMMLLKMTKSLFTKSWLSAALAPAMTQSWAQTRAISMFIWITWPHIVVMKDGF